MSDRPQRYSDPLGLKKHNICAILDAPDITTKADRVFTVGEIVFANTDDLIRQIKSKVKKPYDPKGKCKDCILTLTISSHGGEGDITIQRGALSSMKLRGKGKAKTPGESEDTINAGNATQWAQTMKSGLGNIWCEGAKIIFAACYRMSMVAHSSRNLALHLGRPWGCGGDLEAQAIGPAVR